MTLIELMVAISLLAIVTLMAHRGLDSMMRADARTAGESERWQAATLLFERFSTDVSQPARRPVRNAAGTDLPNWWARTAVLPAATDAQLEFSRKSRPGQDETRLGYRLRNGIVELLIWRALDRAPNSMPEVHPLLENVRELRFRHLDAAGHWQDIWPVNDREDLPRAVSIEIVLGEGTSMKRLFALP